MITVSDLIRQADPLSHEPTWSAEARQGVRQRVLHGAAAAAPSMPLRWQPLVVAVVILCLVVAAVVAIMSRVGLPPVQAQASVKFEIRLAEEFPAPGLQPLALPGRTIYLHRDAIARNIDIASAQVIAKSASGFGVEVTFTPSSAERVLAATRDHVGKPVAILIDGRVVAVPSVRSAISSSAMISGNFSRPDAERIANGMIGR